MFKTYLLLSKVRFWLLMYQIVLVRFDYFLDPVFDQIDLFEPVWTIVIVIGRYSLRISYSFNTYPRFVFVCRDVSIFQIYVGSQSVEKDLADGILQWESLRRDSSESSFHLIIGCILNFGYRIPSVIVPEINDIFFSLLREIDRIEKLIVIVVFLLSYVCT